ncbi:NlpC/P60 family protein [Arthrobacter oryzae]|uniref:NlpC/P60 domain-containing protein n=1 Tax=Arthrobacter oryzae TaxID=409290 RepID=A0A3N0BSG5_9MICC|nr:NlpC/P60 family protein [Arthrobacter oryzae]RNL51972.1 hypothetical protein D7003_14630 [Arthrobacter oryzae]
MSARKISGRRRAVTVHTNPLAVFSKALADNAGGAGRQAAVVVAASGLVLSGGMAAQAAETPVKRNSASVSSLEVTGQVQAPLNADSSVAISFDRPAVSTTPAPVVEAPKPAAAAPAPQATAAVAVQATPRVTVQSKGQVAAAAVAPAAAPAAASGVGAAMVSAAYAQLGMIQDCTALVEKALGAAGIPVGDLAPMQFMGYGKVVGSAQPGDMVVQSGHVGIYVGNGQVLSSGMNGKNQTVVHPLSWLTASGPVTFVRAGA